MMMPLLLIILIMCDIVIAGGVNISSVATARGIAEFCFLILWLVIYAPVADGVVDIKVDKDRTKVQFDACDWLRNKASELEAAGDKDGSRTCQMAAQELLQNRHENTNLQCQVHNIDVERQALQDKIDHGYVTYCDSGFPHHWEMRLKNGQTMAEHGEPQFPRSKWAQSCQYCNDTGFLRPPYVDTLDTSQQCTHCIKGGNAK